MPGWTFRAATQPTPNSGGFRLADEEAKGRPRGRGVERARMQFRAPQGRAALAVWQEPGRLLQSRLTSETSGFDTRSAQVPQQVVAYRGRDPSVSVGILLKRRARQGPTRELAWRWIERFWRSSGAPSAAGRSRHSTPAAGVARHPPRRMARGSSAARP